jgi:hypothetical protein
MDTIYYVVLLRLVTPEAAFWLLRLPATDAPVFVEPGA